MHHLKSFIWRWNEQKIICIICWWWIQVVLLCNHRGVVDPPRCCAPRAPWLMSISTDHSAHWFLWYLSLGQASIYVCVRAFVLWPSISSVNSYSSWVSQSLLQLVWLSRHLSISRQVTIIIIINHTGLLCCNHIYGGNKFVRWSWWGDESGVAFCCGICVDRIVPGLFIMNFWWQSEMSARVLSQVADGFSSTCVWLLTFFKGS